MKPVSWGGMGRTARKDACEREGAAFGEWDVRLVMAAMVKVKVTQRGGGQGCPESLVFGIVGGDRRGGRDGRSGWVCTMHAVHQWHDYLL